MFLYYLSNFTIIITIILIPITILIIETASWKV